MAKVHSAVMPVPAALIGRIMAGDAVRVSFYYRMSADIHGTLHLVPDLVDTRQVKVNFSTFKGVSVTVNPPLAPSRSWPLLTGVLVGTIDELAQNKVTNIWEMRIFGDFEMLDS